MSLEGRSIRNSIDKIKEKPEKNLSDGRPTYSEPDSYETLFEDEQKPKIQKDKLAFLQSLGIDTSEIFTGQSIGKATINSPTVDKEQARAELEAKIREARLKGQKAEEIARDL